MVRHTFKNLAVSVAFFKVRLTILGRYALNKDYHFEVSSNINEVIRSILNFFSQKDWQVQRSTKPLTANKNKKCV